jgi:hypothetical protein
MHLKFVIQSDKIYLLKNLFKNRIFCMIPNKKGESMHCRLHIVAFIRAKYFVTG